MYYVFWASVVPLMISITYFPWLPISLGVCFAIMCVARLARRTQKVLKKHIDDKDRHVQKVT